MTNMDDAILAVVNSHPGWHSEHVAEELRSPHEYVSRAVGRLLNQGRLLGHEGMRDGGQIEAVYYELRLP
jgi:hypothetical protein